MVFRYVNGEASYRGGEATLTFDLPYELTLVTAASYLWGEDTTLDEPVLGVTPLRSQTSLRWQPGSDGRFVEAALNVAGDQNRVSTTRGEQPTDGYETVDIQGGFALPGGLFLRAGINNVFDREVINHLSARDPFTGLALSEPGRVLFTRVSFRF